MTGYLDEGVSNPLSIMTIKSLIDLGYTVDVSKAQDYTIPSSTFSASSNIAKATPAMRGAVKSARIDLTHDGVSTKQAVLFFGQH
jgi:hypothetical protein